MLTLREKFEDILAIFEEVDRDAFISALSVTNIYFLDRFEEQLPDDISDKDLENLEDCIINLMNCDGDCEFAENISELQGELIELQAYLYETFTIEDFIEDILKNWNGELPVIMDVIEELMNQSIHNIVLEDMNSKMTKTIKFEKNILEKELIKLTKEFNVLDISMICEYDLDEEPEPLIFNNTISIYDGDIESIKDDLSDSLLIALSSIESKILINCYNESCDVFCIYGVDCQHNNWNAIPITTLKDMIDFQIIDDNFDKIEIREFFRKK